MPDPIFQIKLFFQSWYYVRFATERCKNASIFLNVPIMKLETNVEYQTGIRSYDMFIATKKVRI